MYVPTKVFFTKGVGYGKSKLESFEAALRDAGIAPFNLVSVSSIFPPNCKIVSKAKALSLLKPGQIVHTVLAKISSNEPNRQLVASVGYAVPKDRSRYGYLSEHETFGQDAKTAGDFAEELAATMLATTLGIKLDNTKAWHEKKEYLMIDGKIVKTSNVTKEAKVPKTGEWTTVVAAAVLIP